MVDDWVVISGDVLADFNDAAESVETILFCRTDGFRCAEVEELDGELIMGLERSECCVGNSLALLMNFPSLEVIVPRFSLPGLNKADDIVIASTQS